MARRFWDMMPCSLVNIYRLPQHHYPDDVGGRFLQNFGTSQKIGIIVASVKTPNPTNLLRVQVYVVYSFLPKASAHSSFARRALSGTKMRKSRAPGRPGD
jgi:hypothetical protein